MADDLTVSNDSAPVLLTRNVAGVITHVDERIMDKLGWTPEELVGLLSTKLVHPDDQASAIAASMEMIIEPGSSRTIAFTNDRLHAIIGSRGAATIDTLLAGVVSDDKPLLEGADHFRP